MARVQKQMQQNLAVSLENTSVLKEMEEKSAELERAVGDWTLTTQTVRTSMFWSKWKNYIIIGVVCIVLLIVIVAPIASSRS